MSTVARLTERDLEAIAMKHFDCYSARVRKTELRESGTWYSLSVKQGPDAESVIVGLRHTKTELLRMIERGPVGKF